MATSVGSAYVSLMPSMDGFASKIGKEFGSQGNAAGKAFGDSMTVGIDGGAKKSSGILTGLGTVARGVATAALAGFTALTGAVTAIGGAALSAYADYEQLVGGVDTLFGSASQTLQGYAAEAYKTCGMSANQYMTQATSFAASLVSSCGGDVAKAADYANMAMGDMSDNVNKMGSDMADVQNAYQGFAKQNYTMLDNLKLGYGGTQAEMKRLIADANKLRQEQGKNADLTIDSYADVVEAIHTVQENMGITGTTAKEAATTISGSIGMAKAAWENFITGLGRDDVDFSQLTQQLLESIGAVATNVAPRVAQIGKGIVEAFPVVLSGLGPVLGPVLSEALATAWNIAVGALAELGIQLPTVDASQITGAFQAIADAAASVVGTCKSAFGKLGEQIPGIWDTIVSTIGGAVTTIISAVSPFVTYFASQMLPAIASFASGAVGAFSAVRPAIEQLGSTLLNVGQAILPVLHNAFAMIVPIISQVIGVAMQLFAAVSPLVSQVGAALMPAITSIGTALANLANAVLPILASGMQIVLSVAQMLIPVIQTVLSVVGSIVSVVITAASQVISVVVNAASVVASAIGLVMSVVSGLVTAVTTFIGSIVSVVGGGRERGGVVHRLDGVFCTRVCIRPRVLDCRVLLDHGVDDGERGAAGVRGSNWRLLGACRRCVWPYREPHEHHFQHPRPGNGLLRRRWVVARRFRSRVDQRLHAGHPERNRRRPFRRLRRRLADPLVLPVLARKARPIQRPRLYNLLGQGTHGGMGRGHRQRHGGGQLRHHVGSSLRKLAYRLRHHGRSVGCRCQAPLARPTTSRSTGEA